ncbi:hypothetical protein L1987_34572 [Smallanthus sonchifolius]|uniref:Uncharacterized protein n=1 Tax=Smallanthus sonchifolius TaxID=185202 RepID=A0ACB9HU91_9ASTR|nr:hypothetical protein L1987_34572 [Smallanthus sonchifolius]
MSDWGPVFVAVVLFILLTPGLLIQIPGHSRMVEFGNFQTSGVSILVHSVIYFALICIFLLAIGIHMYLEVRNAESPNLKQCDELQKAETGNLICGGVRQRCVAVIRWWLMAKEAVAGEGHGGAESPDLKQ